MNPLFLIRPVAIGLILSHCGPEAPRATRYDIDTTERSGLHTLDDNPSESENATAAYSMFHLFCEKSALTDILESPTATDFAHWCAEDGTPTSLLAKHLPSTAYTPESDVRLIQLAAPHHDKEAGTTSITVASALKLPVTAKHYFEMMSALMDDGQRAVDLGVKLVDGQTKNETLTEYEGDGQMHYKGWQKLIRVESTVSDQLIVSEYINHQDHWILEADSIYLLNSYLEESIAGVVNSHMLTAIIQGKQSAYLFTIIHTTAANRGLPSVALNKLISTYKEGIHNAHHNALLTKNETP